MQSISHLDSGKRVDAEYIASGFRQMGRCRVYRVWIQVNGWTQSISRLDSGEWVDAEYIASGFRRMGRCRVYRVWIQANGWTQSSVIYLT